MVSPELHTFTEDAEQSSACSCCGSLNHRGSGDLHSQTKVLADYWYEWPDGHEGQFSLAICTRDDEGEPVEGAGVVVLRASITAQELSYTVVDGEQSPWRDFGAYGQVISRPSFLGGSSSARVFELVDAVVAREHRLAERIERLIEGRGGEI